MNKVKYSDLQIDTDLHIDTEDLEIFEPPENAIDVLNSLEAVKNEKEEAKSMSSQKSSQSDKKFLAEARILKGISRYINSKDEQVQQQRDQLPQGHSPRAGVTEEAEVVETARSGGSSKRNMEGLITHEGAGLQQKMKVNLLNTQKYSSMAQKAFNLNKVNNQLFAEGIGADNTDTSKREGRFNQTGSLIKSGKVVIHLNMRTPTNISYQNSSAGPKGFFAKATNGSKGKGLLDEGSVSHDQLMKYEESLQKNKVLAQSKSNKSMMSTIHAENMRKNQIQDSLENKGVQGSKPHESATRRLGSPGRTELRLNSKLL